MAGESSSRRREKAAEARNAQQAAEKRRERTVRIIGVVVVVLVVVGIIGVAVGLKSSDSSSSAATSTASAPGESAAAPTGVYAAGTEYMYGWPATPVKEGVPTLQLWEDFQCPACGQLEKANGAGIEKLAKDGKINLIYRPTTFLDGNLKNDSSKRATAAWGCAIDAGKGLEYHNYLYANQPLGEGEGWTDEQLATFAANIGISGEALTTWNTCYTERKYLGWALNSTQVFTEGDFQGTPTGVLNGTQLDIKTLADQAALEKAVADATAGGAASPSAS